MVNINGEGEIDKKLKLKSDWKHNSKRYLRIGIVLAISFSCLWIVISAGELWLSWNPMIFWEPQQKRLASDLGVNIDEYPIPMYFPLGYYETKLIPGTDIQEVHDTITGYSKVIRCLDDKEVYYFFSPSEDYSLRIEVWYNTDFSVASINGEDEDSRTISVGICPQGRISK